MWWKQLRLMRTPLVCGFVFTVHVHHLRETKTSIWVRIAIPYSVRKLGTATSPADKTHLQPKQTVFLALQTWKTCLPPESTQLLILRNISLSNLLAYHTVSWQQQRDRRETGVCCCMLRCAVCTVRSVRTLWSAVCWHCSPGFLCCRNVFFNTHNLMY